MIRTTTVKNEDEKAHEEETTETESTLQKRLLKVLLNISTKEMLRS